MEKKAQIGIFLVFAFIILLSIILATFTKQNFGSQNRALLRIAPDEDSEKVQLLISECLGELATQGVINIGDQGGFSRAAGTSAPVITYQFQPSEKNNFSILFDLRMVPAYVYHGKPMMPRIEDFEAELSYFLQTHINECINPSRFNQTPYSATIKGNRISAKVLRDTIRVTIDSPIMISNRISILKKEKSLTSVSAVLNFDYPQKYMILKRIVDTIEHNPGHIPYGLVNHLAMSHHFRYEIVNIDNETILYNFIFPYDALRDYKHSFTVIP